MSPTYFGYGGCRRRDKPDTAGPLAFGQSDRHAILVRHTGSRDGPHTFASRDYACEVERISGADEKHPIIRRGTPDLAQALYGVGQRELLAGHPRDESAAADFSAT